MEKLVIKTKINKPEYLGQILKIFTVHTMNTLDKKIL